jgi:hypothetical protein
MVGADGQVQFMLKTYNITGRGLAFASNVLAREQNRGPWPGALATLGVRSGIYIYFAPSKPIAEDGGDGEGDEQCRT